MTIGKRIKQLRQQKNWSQTQLAMKLGIHQKQISAYERGIHIPSTEQLLRIAKTFKVSLDYLAGENESAFRQLSDIELLQKFQEIDLFPEEDKRILKGFLDIIILKNKFQKLALSKPIIPKKT